MSKKNHRSRTRERKPTWQPISALSSLAPLIDDHLPEQAELLDTLREARTRPYILDDATVKRVVKVHTETLETAAIYGQQLARWLKEPLTDPQRREVERLIAQVERLRAITREILDLADELAHGTIDQVLAMSDEEAGLAFLAGRFGQTGSSRVSDHVADPVTVDVTEEVFERMRKRVTPKERQRLATAPVPYDDNTMLLFLSNMMPCAVAEAVARSACGAGRGMIVGDQTGSEWAFRWIRQGDCIVALFMAAPDTRREVADVVEVYDPKVEAVIVLLTKTSVRMMLAGLDGTYRSPGNRPVEQAPFHLADGITTTSGLELDGTAWYTFSHRTLGTLGRLVIRPRGEREVEVLTEVAKHPESSLDENLRRTAIFLPLASDLTKRLKAGIDHRPR